jgi:hypothetical protein
MPKIRFTQIETAQYTYDDIGGQKISHSLYALDELGDVYKFIPSRKIWVRVEELNISNRD